MKKFSELREASGDTAVFTFGRFNPPTIGHEKLIAKVASVAKSNSAPYYVYPSHSQNAKKDPLPQTLKIAYMRKMFPKHAKNIVAAAERTAIDIATSLYNKGVRNLIMVVGSDRVPEFQKLLDRYNGVQARHGMYDFESIKVVSAGARDPDAEGVEGMSASKMRAAASVNDFASFKDGLPKGFGDAQKLFSNLRKYMGIRESFTTVQTVMTEEDVLRDLYVENKIFRIGDIVTDSYSGLSGKIIRRGTNYVTFVEQDGTTHKKWLYELDEACWAGYKQVGMKKKNGKDVPNCIPEVKQDKDIKDREGTQPAKYYAKDAEGDEMSKSTKAARAKHFEKGAKKDDDDPSAYKPAPGDAGAKTKVSKYTKKFKDMYGESKEEDFQLDEKVEGLVNKSEKSGIAYSILKKVYDRGVAAWRTGHRPGTTPQQWGFARVNSFITGGKTRSTADADLWKQHKGKSESVDLEEARAKKAVAGGKVQKLVTAFGQTYKGKKYDEIDLELVRIDNSSQIVTFRILHPREHIGDEVKIPFKVLRLGRFMATDTSKINKEEEDPREVGTDARREMTQSMTPGQKVKSFTEHLNCGTPECCNECETSSLIESNIYRVGSEKYFEFFNEKRKLYQEGKLELQGFDKQLIEGDIGKFAEYEGKHVPLDTPMIEVEEEKDVELGKPKKGGPKKYYVYVKDPSTGNVKKVSWGDTTGLKVKLSDPEARKSFAARHKCDQQKDRTKAAYWACNLPRYAKQLGLSGGGNFFW